MIAYQTRTSTSIELISEPFHRSGEQGIDTRQNSAPASILPSFSVARDAETTEIPRSTPKKPNSFTPCTTEQGLSFTPKRVVFLAEVVLFPKSTKADVRDGSKADTIAKLQTCTQTLWVLVRCLSRAGTGLPLILHEVHTMTYIAYALTTYAKWV